VRFHLASDTIADLAREDSISDSHIVEAVQYRSMDKRLFE
jgi:predicted ATPase with chaperone activity